MDSIKRIREDSNLKLRIRVRSGPRIRANSGRIRIRANSCEFEPASLVGVRVVGAGVRLWGPCSVPVGAARRGAGPRRSYAGGRAGGGGVRRFLRLCGRGGACRAGDRSASFRPSAFPGQATKRASLALCCPWGAWPPIPLRFVLTRLLWVRSVRRPGAQAWARLFFAAPMCESAALGRCGCRRARGRQDQWGRHARSLPGCCYWGWNRIHEHQRRREQRQQRQDPC